MSASLYFATKKAKNRTCNTMENGVAILWKNVLQLSPKSTCKKQYEEAINVILAVEKSIYILVFINENILNKIKTGIIKIRA